MAKTTGLIWVRDGSFPLSTDCYGLSIIGHVMDTLLGSDLDDVAVFLSEPNEALRAYLQGKGTRVIHDLEGIGLAKGALLVVLANMPLIDKSSIFKLADEISKKGATIGTFEGVAKYLPSSLLKNQKVVIEELDSSEDKAVLDAISFSDVSAGMRSKINFRHMRNGVRLMDPEHTYIDATVSIGDGTEIFPGTFILGKSKIGKNCLIANGVFLKDMIVADAVEVKPYSVLESSEVESSAVIGPFSRVRPESVICSGARVGNFVEIKKTRLGKGSKANHLSYLGDAVIGERVNIGCGTITCNYDGFEKFRTTIEDEVFVGSDTQFVAPVKIGKGATIGAGSTITKNVPPNSLALSRVSQVVEEGWQRKKKTKKTGE